MGSVVVFENRFPWPVKLRECFSWTQNGSYGDEIEVGPNSKEEFPATLFLNHNYYSLRPSQILLFVAEAKLDQSLISQTFVRYVKVILDVNRDGQVVVLGVPSKLTDFCRLWGCGFLGREYRGRPEVLIARCRLEAA